MSIASRIEAIEQHLTDDYSVLTLAGADLTNVDKNILNLKPTWKERLLYFMNNGTQQVWDNWTKVNGTGETLTLNNTEEAPMSLVYKGNTLQNGTPTPDSPVPIQVVSGDNSIEVCGKNLFDESKLTLATEVVDGKTCYKIAGINTGTANRIWDKQLKENTQYTISMVAKKVQYFNIICIKYTDGTASSRQFTNTTFETISATSTAGKTIEYITIDTGAIAATNYIEVGTIQLEEGTTATTYEAYTGESYPISLGIQNLFDGIMETGSFNASGLNSNDYTRIRTKNYIAVKPDTQYTISYKNNTTKTQQISLSYYSTNDYTTARLSYKNWITDNPLTFTTPSGCYYIRFLISFTTANIGIGEGSATDIKVKEGDNTTNVVDNPIQLLHIPNTDYYDKTDKSTGKNLFDKDNANILNCYMTSTGTIGNSSNDKLFYVSCKSNTTYTIQKILGTSGRLRVGSFTNVPANNSTPTVFVNRDNNTTATITTGANDIYLAVQYFASDTDNQALLNSIMLNEGTTALPYEPYGTGWYVKKEIGKVVFDGSENSWVKYSALDTTNNNCYYIPLDTLYVDSTGATKVCLSNYFTGVSFNDKGTDTANMWGSKFAKQLYLKIQNTITTITELQTWLSTHNTIVHYVLATPTYTLIEDSTLIEELESMKKSYENQTNISQENNDMPFILDITALSKE